LSEQQSSKIPPTINVGKDEREKEPSNTTGNIS
jgi:hypothetical protein